MLIITSTMVCPNVQRWKLLEEQIRKLEAWMASHSTEPQLARLVAEYPRRGGRKKIAKLYVPRELRELARTQDKIGWRNFREGKISKCFHISQGQY